MYKIALLSIIFLFICWLLYNINTIEGFQSPSGTATTPSTKSECDILVNSYKLLENQYNNALEQNNKKFLESILSSKNMMMTLIKDMKCEI
jgi:hypothetical protein